MLEFKQVDPLDREWVLPLLRAEAIRLCDYSFSALYGWQRPGEKKLCRLEDRLLIHVHAGIGEAYLWPTGKGDPVPALRALEEHARAKGEPLRLVALLEEHKPILESLFAGRIEYMDGRDNYDYLYDIDRLADLPGKKLHAKRNHIRRLHDNCPGWTFHSMNLTDIADCKLLDKIWFEEHIQRFEAGPERDSLQRERTALLLALDNFTALGLDGGLIRWKDEVLAFTLGSRLTEEIYDVHFERAKAELQGAFPAINQEFAKWIRATYPEVKQIDREEDMGNPGLRKAKLSYGPDELVENFCAVIETGPEFH